MEETADTSTFAEYIRSVPTLEELENISQALTRELADSHKMLAEVKATYDSMSCITHNIVPVDYQLRHDHISQFLEAGTPQLLLPDMNQIEDVDLDVVIQSMRKYAEELRKKCTGSQLETPSICAPVGEMHSMELDKYGASLDQLCKRMENIKFKKDEVNKRNPDLEQKFEKLYFDINMFTQIIQVKTKLSESNKYWKETPQAYVALQYDEIFNRVVSGINEVMYLMQSKNLCRY